MNDLLRKRKSEIVGLCGRHHVRRLSVFGSAVGESFDPRRSDVDLLVEFEAMVRIPADRDRPIRPKVITDSGILIADSGDRDRSFRAS